MVDGGGKLASDRQPAQHAERTGNAEKDLISRRNQGVAKKCERQQSDIIGVVGVRNAAGDKSENRCRDSASTVV